MDEWYVETFAGAGRMGNRDGSVHLAEFSYPSQVKVAGNGDVYVAEETGSIRVIRDGCVSTVRNVRGDAIFVGKDSVLYGYDFVTQSLWMQKLGCEKKVLIRHDESFVDGYPLGSGEVVGFAPRFAVSDNGDIYIADKGNGRVCRYRNGSLTTLAGSPAGHTDQGFADGPYSQARFNLLEHIDIGRDGTIYVTDRFNHRIRFLRHGSVGTFAGSAFLDKQVDGPVTKACFASPYALSVVEDHVFVSDLLAIRCIYDGRVFTVVPGHRPEDARDGPAHKARFGGGVVGICASSAAEVYIADSHNHCVRVLRKS